MSEGFMSEGFTRPFYTTLSGNSFVPAPLHIGPGHEFITPDPQKERDHKLDVFNFKIRERETQNGRAHYREFPKFADGTWTDNQLRALMEAVYQHGTSFHVIKADPLFRETLLNKTKQQLADKWREVSRHAPAGNLTVHTRLDAFHEARRPY